MPQFGRSRASVPTYMRARSLFAATRVLIAAEYLSWVCGTVLNVSGSSVGGLVLVAYVSSENRAHNGPQMRESREFRLVL